MAGVGVEGNPFRILQPKSERIEICDNIIHPIEQPVRTRADDINFAVYPIRDIQDPLATAIKGDALRISTVKSQGVKLRNSNIVACSKFSVGAVC